jgi:hypothetical protein
VERVAESVVGCLEEKERERARAREREREREDREREDRLMSINAHQSEH